MNIKKIPSLDHTYQNIHGPGRWRNEHDFSIEPPVYFTWPFKYTYVLFAISMFEPFSVFYFFGFFILLFWWHANLSYRCKIGCLQLPLFLWKHNMAPNKEHKRHPFCTLAFIKMMYNACCLYCVRCHDGNKMYITKTLLMQWLSEPNETTECKWKERTIQWRTYSTISFIRIRLQNQVKNSSTWYMKREDRGA